MARVQARKTQGQEQTKTQEQAKAQTRTKPQPQQVKTREQTSEVVFAMDIGTRSIIGMVGVVEEEKIRIVAVEKEDHTERAMIDGQIENIEKVSILAGKVKKRLEERSGFKLSRVCVAAAGRALRTKRADFEMELAGTRLIDDEIVSRLEAGAITRAEEIFDAENEAAEDDRRFYLVGYTVCQYYLDEYMISNLKDHRGRHVKVDLIATFLPSEVVESLYTTMNKIGLEVASLTLEPIAAINAAIPENIRLLNLVLVDIGAGTSDIAACTGGSITGYTMATVAGDEITETIMKEYLVDFSTAEDVKARLDVEEEIAFKDILGMEHRISRDDIFQCIQGTSGFLCREIADKVLEINGTAPSALFLAGGGSKLAGLKEGLTIALGMEPNRVAIAGNYFNANAFSDAYDLNNPEYATPLGIAVSSGLNMINDRFRVILNGRPAKLFRSGSFTALNLLMMNGYNFRDLLGRAGQNLTVTVNGARKVFYGTSSEPASLLINQKEGKLSDIIHAGDTIDFVPALQGDAAKACLGDIEGTKDCVDVTLNGIHVPLKTPLKSGDVIHMVLPVRAAETEAEETEETKEPAGLSESEAKPEKERDREGLAESRKVQAESGERESSEATEPESRKNNGEEPQAGALAGEAGGADRAQEKAAGAVNSEGEDAGTEAGGGRSVGTEAADAAKREAVRTDSQRPQTAMDRLSRLGARVMPVAGEEANAHRDAVQEEPVHEQEPVREDAVQEETIYENAVQEESVHGEAVQQEPVHEAAAGEPAASAEESVPAREDRDLQINRTVTFQLNGAPLELPRREDDRPYYLMDLIQYSGIDLEHPKGVVKLTVNGVPAMFRQALVQGDTVYIGEEKR